MNRFGFVKLLLSVYDCIINFISARLRYPALVDHETVNRITRMFMSMSLEYRS